METTLTQIDSQAAGRSPLRTCVGCRQIAEQRSLARAVADAAGRLRFDGRQREPGRGVYVHKRNECIVAALRGGFSRSLRRKVVVSDAVVLSELGLPAARAKNQDNHS